MPLYENYVWRLVLTDPAYDVQLPQDLHWIDESWSPISMSTEITLTGSLVVQESTMSSGRPITLQGNEDMGWVPRNIYDTLLNMAALPSATMKLQYVEYINGSYGTILHEFDVMWRHTEKPVVDGTSVKGFDDFEPDNWYKNLLLKFITVATTAPCN
jgi:hypothetical protein